MERVAALESAQAAAIAATETLSKDFGNHRPSIGPA